MALQLSVVCHDHNPNHDHRHNYDSSDSGSNSNYDSNYHNTPDHLFPLPPNNTSSLASSIPNASTPTPHNQRNESKHDSGGPPQPGPLDLTTSPHQPRTTLLDFPTEIMLIILDSLPDDSLYAFSFTSHKFHRLALSLYLSRHGVGALSTHQLKLAVYDDHEIHSKNVVRALKAALFAPELNSVYYHIGTGGEGGLDAARSGDNASTRNGIDTLCEILDKGSSVREMVVNVDRAGVGDGDGSDSIARGEILPDFMRVLDRALTKKCQSIMVYHSGVYSPDVDAIQYIIKRSFSGIRWLIKRLKQLLTVLPANRMATDYPYHHNDNQHTNCNTTGIMTTPVPPNVNLLTHFGIHSPILFHPESCEWTIDTLNASSHLTTLTITQQLHMPPEAWALLLPCLSLPALTTLSIDLMALSTEDLFAFLKRHNNILNLDIGKSIAPPDPFVPFPSNALPNLTNLRGPPKWLTHMMLPPNSLPGLKQVTMMLKESGKQRVCAAFMSAHVTLLPVIERIQNLEQFGVVLSFSTVSTGWIPTVDETSSYRYLAIDASNSTPFGGTYTTAVGIPGSSGSVTFPESISAIENLPTSPTSVVYTHATHLRLDLKSYMIPFGITTQEFIRWLEGLTKLRSLEVITLGHSTTGGGSGSSGFRAGWEYGEAREAPFVSVLQKETFIDSVKIACPNVETVRFGRLRGRVVN